MTEMEKEIGMNGVETRGKTLHPPATNPSASVANTDMIFAAFPNFPAEIRAKIWEASIVPRIVRCKRKGDKNVFAAPSKSLPLLAACQESREAAKLYGCYLVLSTAPYVYFSPKIDFLLFDVGWKPLNPPQMNQPLTNLLQSIPPQQDFLTSLESIDPNLKAIRNVMVHPNWSDERMVPTVQLAEFPQLEQVLVASDEKSIGFRSEIMFSSVHDLRMYYASVRQPRPKIPIPRIAVGCLGWTGSERWAIQHADEDNRRLVAVFQDYAAMKAHQRLLREEEQRFTQERFSRPRPSFMLKLQKAREAHGAAPKPVSPVQSASEVSHAPEEPVALEAPPTYADIVPGYSEPS